MVRKAMEPELNPHQKRATRGRKMEKWEAEIKDMLAKQNWEPLDWEDFFKQIMPFMHLMMTMAVGGIIVHSPEGRNELRKHLFEAGCPTGMVDQTIYWVIEHGTSSW